MNERDFDSYWLGEDGKVWRIAYYCERPSVTFERVDDPTIRRGGAVGSPLVNGYTRLVPATGELARPGA